MSVVKRIIKDSVERMRVEELLAREYEQAGFGGITLTKTPLGSQINLFAMRPGRVIGRRGRAIKEASLKLEEELGLSNPQITVIEVEVPELNPLIMASRVANALERGIHFRRAVFWSLNRIMEAGALGCEIVLRGPLRSARSRFEKVVEGYVPKAGDPALKQVRTATMHVKMKRGVLGVTVNIVPPDAKFPDKVDLSELPPEEYQPPAPVEAAPEAKAEEPEALEEAAPEAVEPEPVETIEPVEEAAAEAPEAPVEEAREEAEPHGEPEEAESVEAQVEDSPAEAPAETTPVEGADAPQEEAQAPESLEPEAQTLEEGEAQEAAEPPMQAQEETVPSKEPAEVDQTQEAEPHPPEEDEDKPPRDGPEEGE